jgi:predicted nuclease of predicted toxin-antitoxin system
MKIHANENFPGDAVTLLRAHGHDVHWGRTDSPGATDDRVLTQAQAEQRIIVTFDKDFGELAFRQRLSAACGIVLFRVATPSPEAAAQTIVAVLESRDNWAGHFSVVEPGRVRMRNLPAIQ